MVVAQAPPPASRSRRYRAGQVIGTSVLVVLVAIIGYVTFVTAARLGEPGPAASASAAAASHAETACERAVADVIDQPDLAIAACSSQIEIDDAYRTVFHESPQWGSALSDACAADPKLRARPLCATPTPTPRPSESGSEPSQSTELSPTAGPSGSLEEATQTA